MRASCHSLGVVGVLALAATSATAFADAPQRPKTALVPADSFEMGKMINYGYGDMDGPTHTVAIARPFEIGVYEVTLGEFRAFVKDTGYVSRGKCNVYEKDANWFIHPDRNWEKPGFPQEESHPVVCVSWKDAKAYLEWLSKKTGEQYRLPTEAEFEYVAARGGVGDAKQGGAITHEVANIGKAECCGGEKGGKDVWHWTAPVGSFPADKFGVHDLRGNVWEWTEDCYHVNYEGAPVDGSARTACPTPGFHPVRGGSYGDASEYMGERFRLRGPADQGYFTVGFRVARLAQPDSPEAARPFASMLEATRRRDVEGLSATLSASRTPEIVYYWGETVSGREAIAQWHKEWFEEQGWKLGREQPGAAFADERLGVLAYTIEYIKNPQRKFLILMNVTTIREGAEWKVARIQQTLLDGPKD